MRFYLGLLICAVMLSGCGSGGGGRLVETTSNARPSPAANDRIDRCVDRLLQGAKHQTGADKEAVRRYARNTYCSRFEQEGWIYEDGALRIAAHNWLEKGGTCAIAGEGEPARTVPCEPERRGRVRVLECALLRIVRRSEVRAYLDRLRTSKPVECGDGTALDKLGVP